MFQRGYLLQELRRRWGRTLVTALGLAVGVGLVLGIIGLSQGLSEAQTAVLQPLSSIGTDILVTRVATSTATGNGAPNNGAPNNGGGGFFANGANGGGGGGAAVALNGANASDATALLAENSNVTTDLSKLGPAGTKFTHDFFLSSTLLSFPADALTATVNVPGVASATAGLTQLVEHQTGTVPTQTATFVTGGETLTATSTPAPLTDAEQAAVQSCLQSSGIRIGERGGTTATVTPKVGGAPSPASSGAPDNGLRFGGGGGAFQKCLPARFQQYTASVTTARRSISLLPALHDPEPRREVRPDHADPREGEGRQPGRRGRQAHPGRAARRNGHHHPVAGQPGHRLPQGREEAGGLPRGRPRGHRGGGSLRDRHAADALLGRQAGP